MRNRNAWSDTFVDALCEPLETLSFGDMFAHVITFNAYQRLPALDALRRLGVKVEGRPITDLALRPREPLRPHGQELT